MPPRRQAASRRSAPLGEGDIDCVFISHPNNPTGNLQPETFLIDVLNATDALVLVDEAYFEFSRHTMRPHMERHRNLVILRTFSKAFSMAGLRVGYLLGQADVICELMKVRQPYSVDSFAQWVARAVFKDRMWVFGGTENFYDDNDQTLKNDVWSSSDGKNWKLQTAQAAWPKRTSAKAVVFDDRWASAAAMGSSIKPASRAPADMAAS